MVEKKKVSSQLYFGMKTKLTILEIMTFAEKNVHKLIEQAQKLDLEIIGPLEFIYDGIDGTPETKFDLTMVLPIKEKKGDSASFQYMETKPAVCVYTTYKGAMSGIGKAWGQFMNDIHASGVKTTDECREIYKKWIEPESNDNITELQATLAS
jgi:effector-binding domain-containing protein